MNKKKLIYLVSELPAVSHTFIMREIKGLREEGYEIQSVSVNTPKGPFSENSDEDQELKELFILKKYIALSIFKIFIKLPFLTPLFLPALKYIINGQGKVVTRIAHVYEALLLASFMETESIEHIHVHFANSAAQIASLACCIKNFTYSISVHGPDVFENATHYNLKNKLYSATFVRCISKYSRYNIIRHLGPDFAQKVHIVHCGIDPEIYLPQVKSKKIKCLCVGRIIDAKGQYFLLQAIREIIAKGYDFECKFIGDGYQKNYLEQLSFSWGLNHHIKFTGALDRKEVLEELKTCNLFVLPSLAEGIPVSLMEAMSCEIPVISTIITGIPELIQHKENGMLCEPADKNSLVQCLDEIISKPILANHIAKNARLKIINEFNINHSTQQMVELFKEYLDSNTTQEIRKAA